MTAKKRKIRIALAAVLPLLIALGFWTVWGNTALQLHTYTVRSDTLPASFNGYRIAHVSDLHNAEMGTANEKLLAMLQDARPDSIAITGDLIDSRHTNKEIALQFAKEAANIAPCYYVTGNHEARVPEYDEFKDDLAKQGIVILENERVDLKQSDETVTLLGVNDPSFQTDYLFGDAKTVLQTQLQQLINEDDGYTILLSHRPELFEVYVKSGVDLVLSGHAHGGQFRLPFVGGLVAPNQGVFPKYDAGLYTEETTNMIVSRGIGNSLFPFRFNNRPEVVLIELQCEAS